MRWPSATMIPPSAGATRFPMASAICTMPEAREYRSFGTRSVVAAWYTGNRNARNAPETAPMSPEQELSGSP